MAVKSTFLRLFGFCVLLSLNGMGYCDIVVVGNQDAPELSKSMAKQIFLKKIDVLPNGITVTPIDLSDNNEIKWDFYQKVAGKKPAQIHSYWSRAVFSGKGNPPEQVDSVAELKRMIAKNRGVIGYIDEKDVSPDMKILLRIAI